MAVHLTPTPQSDRSDAAAEAARWAARRALRDLGPGETAELKTWLAEAPTHAEALTQAERALAVLDGAELAVRGAHRAARRTARARHVRWAALAASVAGLAILGGGLAERGDFGGLPGEVAAPTGDVRRQALSDGTIVWLDTRTALKVDYSATTRRVELLRGRAFFQVVHDPSRPFQVAVGGGQIRDVGTAFGVDRDGGSVWVGVTQGQVEVRAGGADVSLAPGLATRWRTGETAPEPQAFDAETALAWRDSRLVADHQTLGDVVAELNRYRWTPLVLLDRAAARRPVSGVVRLNAQGADLDSLADSQGLSVQRLGLVTLLGAKTGTP